MRNINSIIEYLRKRYGTNPKLGERDPRDDNFGWNISDKKVGQKSIPLIR